MKSILAISAAVLATVLLASGVLASVGGGPQTSVLQTSVACTQSDGQCSGDTPICDVTSGNCVAQTCGITPNGGLTFSTLIPGQTSGAQEITLTNGGNAPTTSLAVTGNDWTTAGSYGGDCKSLSDGQTCFPVSATQVSQNNANWYQLSNTPGLTGFYSGVIPNGQPYGLFFTVTPPVNTAAGTYYQTVTFTSGC